MLISVTAVERKECRKCKKLIHVERTYGCHNGAKLGWFGDATNVSCCFCCASLWLDIALSYRNPSRLPHSHCRCRTIQQRDQYLNFDTQIVTFWANQADNLQIMNGVYPLLPWSWAAIITCRLNHYMFQPITQPYGGSHKTTTNKQTKQTNKQTKTERYFLYWSHRLWISNKKIILSCPL